MIIDIIVAAVLVVSAVIAFLRGLIREVLTIFGVVGALAAAYVGGPVLSPYVKDWLGVVEGEEPKKLFDIIPYPLLGDIIAYGGIFIAVAIALSILSHVLAEGARAIGLGPIDRTFGVIFGLLRGVVLLGLVYMPFYLLMDKETKETWFEGSKTFFYLEQTAEAMANFLPEGTKQELEKKAGELEEKSETRKKLEEMNILGGQKEQAQEETAPPTQEENKKGYTEEFRDEMDQLFEQKDERKMNE